jgi:hypothetical protein
MDIKREYPTYEAIEEHIRRARLERSVALGNFIATIVHSAIQGLANVGHLLHRGMQPAPRRRSLET